MPAGIYNFTIDQGETFTRVLELTDEADTPLNLTGYSARMQFRESRPGAIALSLTSANGGISLGGALGTVTLAISEVQTANLPATVYYYDLELVSGTGVVTKLLKGTVSVLAEVTV